MIAPLMQWEPLRQKINRLVNRAGDCWEYTGKTDHGYARFWFLGKLDYGHRWSYRAFVGPIPEGLHVLHHCDNKRCINPEHLYAGTHQDNMRDMVERGQRKGKMYGEGMPTAKLNDEAVRAIRWLVSKGKTVALISRLYSVNEGTIYMAARGITWAHVGPEGRLEL